MALLAEEFRPKKRSGGEARMVDVLPERLNEAVMSQAATTWRELRAIEIVTEEIAEEFAGEHPLRQAHFDSLAQSKERLVGLRELTGEYKMLDPAEEEVDVLRKAIRKWAGP